MRFLVVLTLFLILSSMAQAQRSDPYSKEWKQVLAFEKKGLTESAGKVVHTIYTKAKKNGQTEQIIKALMYKLGHLQYKEEETTVKAIALLEAELKTAKFPEKQIIHSMLGELYQS